MDNAQLLQNLEDLADQLSVEIRYENLDGSLGGLFRLRGRSCILLDRNLSVAERLKLVSRSLAKLHLDGVFIPPAVREILEQQATSSS